MPELPEVETVRRGLEGALSRRRLAKVTLRRADLRFPFPQRFVARLTGTRIEEIRRRGKFLLAPLDSAETLIMHMGMTGRFVVDEAAPGAAANGENGGAPMRHAHVVLETEDGPTITFIDARRFGFMDLERTDGLAGNRWLASLGPEPFDDAFDEAWLTTAFAGRRQGVKATLMDQRVVAGLGNIYASECLHRARIAPGRPANAIGTRGLARLAAAVRSVLGEAIAAGGSTLRDFAAANGSPGYFQHSFRVYGREGEACVNRACRGRIRRSLQAGRATYHCPACQR